MGRSADYRTEQVGLRLTHHLAPAVYEYRAALRREQSVADGWATRGETAGRGSPDNSLPEAAVLMVGHLEQVEARLNLLVVAVETAADQLAKMVIGGFGEHVPASADQLRCRDAQKFGRGIWDTKEWSDDIECEDLPTKLGLCARHYSAYYRFRRARNIKPDRDEFEPVDEAKGSNS